ncbi:MAG: HEAT repeat domain-containing protein [Myxococcota bacterium]
MTARFRQLVEEFRAWAKVHPKRCGEWECEWDHWDLLYPEIQPILLRTPAELSEAELDAILYVLARDNEAQQVQMLLEANPSLLLSLASRSLSESDPDARWQLADSLARVRGAESAALLESFASDSDEYVRRRALSAMAHSSHINTEHYATEAFDSGTEYSQLTALHALQQIQSSKLTGIAQNALEAKSELVRQRAAEVLSDIAKDRGER